MTVQTAPARNDAALRATRGRLWTPLLTFGLALAFALWHHLIGLDPRATFFADSRSYLETCRKLIVVATTLATGAPTGPTLHGGLSAFVGADLMHDGPILPLMPAVLFTMAGKLPTPLDWRAFVIFGSCMHALSAALVCLATLRLTDNQKWSFVAGLAWATYPAAIIASGRYLCEGPTAVFLLAFLWCATRLLENAGAHRVAFAVSGAALGVLTGLVMLLKPALVPVLLAVNVLALLFVSGWKHRVSALVTVMVGLAAVIGPWVVCSKAITGTAYLTPQRTPVYNVALGADTEADGWPARPNPPLTAALSKESGIIAAAVKAWSTHPGELLNLSLRKVGRLWVGPWNDFRATVLGLTPELSAWWHVALLVLSIGGMFSVLSGAPIRQSSGKAGRVAMFVGLAAILLTAGHFMYVPFAAIVRYAFTAMPYVVILAVYGLFTATRVRGNLRIAASASLAWIALAALWSPAPLAALVAITGDYRAALLVKFACECVCLAAGAVMSFAYINRIAGDRRHEILAKTGAAIVVAGVLAIMSAYCFDGRYGTEWSCPLALGQSACRQVHLPPGALNEASPAPTAALLMDVDAPADHLLLSINGHHSTQKPQLLFRLCPSRYFLLDMMRVFAGQLHQPVEQSRQWRAVVFPAAWLNRTGANVIRVSNVGRSPATLYGDYLDQWKSRRFVPSFDYFSAELFGNTMSGYEGRLPDMLAEPQAASSSWLERDGKRQSADLSADAGRQIGQYRLMLAIFSNRQAPPSQQFSADAQAAASTSTDQPAAFEKRLSSRDFDPILSDHLIPGSDLRMNKPILKAATRLGTRVDVPENLSRLAFLQVKVSGAVRAAKTSCLTSLLVNTRATSSHDRSILPATPPYLKAGAQWSAFEFSDVVPSERAPGGLKALEISLFPGAWEDVREYGCDRRCGDAFFKNLKVELVPLNSPRLDDPGRVIY